MNSKFILALLVACAISVTIFLASQLLTSESHENEYTLFQVSSIDSLLKGQYEGKISDKDLLSHGDFGLGAMEYMDGELVCLNKNCYQIKTDSHAHKLNPDSKVTFASVVFFKSDMVSGINKQASFSQLQDFLDKKINDQNGIYAIKIHGLFANVTARSVHKQDSLFVPLSDVVGNQTVFHFTNVKGTLVGFYMPDYMRNLNVKNYHFHFISDDYGFGGHILDFNMTNGTIQVLKIKQVQIVP